MDAPQRYRNPQFGAKRPTRRWSRAQIEEVLSFLESESSVRQARVYELQMAGVDPGLIAVALAEIRQSDRKKENK